MSPLDALVLIAFVTVCSELAVLLWFCFADMKQCLKDSGHEGLWL